MVLLLKQLTKTTTLWRCILHFYVKFAQRYKTNFMRWSHVHVLVETTIIRSITYKCSLNSHVILCQDPPTLRATDILSSNGASFAPPSLLYSWSGHFFSLAYFSQHKEFIRSDVWIINFLLLLFEHTAICSHMDEHLNCFLFFEY